LEVTEEKEGILMSLLGAMRQRDPILPHRVDGGFITRWRSLFRNSAADNSA
jgi:hypothetical protein